MNESHQGRELAVVSAADDGYAMQLAVAMRSVIDRLSPDSHCRLFIIDAGLSEHSRARCLASWADRRVQVDWLTPPLELVRDLPVSDHVNQTSYLRLLLDELLPAGLGKCIYLDADLVVRHDLTRLWNEPLAGHPVLAVNDAGSPRIDATLGLPAYPRCGHLLAAARPVPNYRELRLDPSGKYFNAGVMLVNLDHWRREALGRRSLAALARHREHVVWWDQYALNVILAGRWGELDLRWNQVTHVHAYPGWHASPFDGPRFTRLRDDPWVIHYCSASKPWHADCHHPWAGEFFRVLDTTPWRGWRPTAPGPRQPPPPRRRRWQRLKDSLRNAIQPRSHEGWPRNHTTPASGSGLAEPPR
jgi:lipopolysaccharide biosynthesis glycosyltransferase